MKTVQINSTCGVGSTGKICVEISKLLTQRGVDNKILYTVGTCDYPLGIKYSDEKYAKLQALKSRVMGNYGFNSRLAAKKLIGELEKISPDVVHLHNLHSHDCNLEELFEYFKSKKMRLIWTFHDCWAFTGYCPHFSMVGCDKWKTGCQGCVQKKYYSWFFDKSGKLYEKKKELFSGLDLTIVSPSRWLADITRSSFLGTYPVKVINNGIDLNTFKPIESKFRVEHGLTKKHIVLGVAFDWGQRKGLDVFVELAGILPEEYQIVLVGTDESVDKSLSRNIISIHKTASQLELAKLYTAADVFVNPTREEVFGLVNVEALACGTPVVTFNAGGSPETLDEACGSVVEVDDIDGLREEIERICVERPFSREACIERAREFDMHKRFCEYTDLYFEVCRPTAK